jgi:hypothetical protein
MKWNQIFRNWHMSRRINETIKQYDLRKIDEEAKRMANYKAKPKVQFGDRVALNEDEDESLPAHVAQDLKFCQAMVRAGYVLRELEEVRG